MKKGKSKNQAVLRTLANKNALNFATKRLLKDLDEIEHCKIPTVGVSARPLEKDLFRWHANLRGPQGTPYEGGIFHIELQIPENYPHSPPKVHLFQSLPHPNVFDTTVCLDMLQDEKWSSAYTIQSILLQLQSFLFEVMFNEEEKKAEIKKAVMEANQFACKEKQCKHGGKLSAWPAFTDAPDEDQKSFQDKFKIVASEQDLFKQELVCFHTKQKFTETCLGIGLNLQKIPRSGAIRQASPALDILSIKAYIKEGIRKSIDGEKFSNWFPLYFGECKPRSIHLAKKAISMVYTNNTKRFKEEQTLDIFPKILLTLAYQMMDEKRHSSVRIIRLFFHVMHMFLLFLEEYPGLQEEIEKRLENFITDEKIRHKDFTPNLGVLLVFSLLSNKINYEKLIPIYFQEQLDRQVFWILKQIPELTNKKFFDDIDAEKRIMITFKMEITGYHILCFFKMIKSYINEKFTTIGKLLETLNTNTSKLQNSIENEFQQNCFKILKIDNYFSFLEFVGYGKITSQELAKLLIKAVDNSTAKKYHGKDDDILTLPKKEEQMASLKTILPKIEDYFITVNSEEKLAQRTQEEWLDALKKRYIWIKELLVIEPDLTAYDVLVKAKEKFTQTVEKPQTDRMQEIRKQYLQNDLQKKYENQTLVEKIERKFNWQELFIKMDIEDHLLYMDENPDFQLFYKKLKILKQWIISIIIPIFLDEEFEIWVSLFDLVFKTYFQFKKFRNHWANLQQKPNSALQSNQMLIQGVFKLLINRRLINKFNLFQFYPNSGRKYQ
eukprot:TRINITY_DN308_c0_g2_i4.p1 TRINITY_DN308_c0_g2~~TRINITY_DN308_c0_g2_i4.p1  ORF type:complete len:778 (+),score=123.89 TRINITY_DN308_c0_g2_i4:151-2484(+)